MDATLAAFVITALAVYRVATDVALMDGPFGLFVRLRVWVGERFHATAPWLVAGVGCPICVAWWVALPLYALAWLAPPVVWWLGLAGAAAALHRGLR